MENYEKVRVIGRGAYGTVYLCSRLSDRRPVIIKQIPVETMTKEERLAALNEVKVLEMLQHPLIVEYYDYFLEDKALMIVMEFMEGGTLFDFLQQRQGHLLDEDDVLRVFVQLLIALQHVHSKQILHRDLKTQNILLDKSKVLVKIGDFGISKVLSSKSKADSRVGTPCYYSPELCEGKPYNQKSDIWALGCVLYELATLRKAFDAGNPIALVSKIMRGAFAPIGDAYSTELDELVVAMLRLDPSKRPRIDEILCQPLVVNAYMNYFANVGKLPAAATAATAAAYKPHRVISFSTEAGGGGGGAGRVNAAGGEGATKSSLKQPKSSNPLTRGGSSGSLLPPGLCPLDAMAFHCGYDLAPLPPCVVYCWGGSAATPLRLPLPNAETEVVQVSIGRAQKAGVTKDGRVVLWDHHASSTFDSGATYRSTASSSSSLFSTKGSTPGKAAPESGAASVTARFLEGQAAVTIAEVACGDLFVACLTDRGILMTYGSGANGCLGHGATVDVPQTKAKIVEALLGYEIVGVAAGASHVLALTNDHELFAWGRGDNGRLGLGDAGVISAGVVSKPTPVPFPPSHRAASVFCGGDASVVLTDVGRMFCCGSNRANKLALDAADAAERVVEEAASLRPTPDSSPLSRHPVARVAIGASHSGAVTRDGDLYVFGSNQFGQLGSAAPAESSSAVPRRRNQRVAPVLALRGCCFVSCGDTFTVAACLDGAVRSWGKSARGRLGREVNGDSADAVAIDFGVGEPKLKAVSLVSSHGNTLLAGKPADEFGVAE